MKDLDAGIDQRPHELLHVGGRLEELCLEVLYLSWGDAHRDREIRTGLMAYLIDDVHREADPVTHGTAVVVGTAIRARPKEYELSPRPRQWLIFNGAAEAVPGLDVYLGGETSQDMLLEQLARGIPAAEDQIAPIVHR